MNLKPGDTIGEYRILEIIGNGGFSVVYKALDTSLMRSVAIKQYSPEVFSEESTREWFVREARLSASLNHPNIVSIHALRQEGDLLFLVMEYLPGGDLLSLIEEQGPVHRDLLLKVAANVCHALETLHARNVIHRDIKPENILIAHEGHFKLTDFGLAHIHQQHGPNRSVGPQPGTLLYMSPEQATAGEVTPRSDIYSLAVVLYEAISGHYYLDYHHEIDTDDDLRDLILNADPLPIQRWHKSVPRELIAPIHRALSKDPALRPRTAREFLAELRSAAARSKHATLSNKAQPLPNGTPQASPDLLRSLYVIRTLRDADKKPNVALRELQTIWQQHNGLPEVAAEYGETLVALGQETKGRHYLEQALHLKPNLPFAQIALADILRTAEADDADIEAALIAAIHADPDLAYAVLYEDIVNALSDPLVYENYVNAFHQAAETLPRAPLYHNLGMVLALATNRQADAIAAFRTALQIDPDYGPPYIGLSSILTETNRVEDAVELLQRARFGYYPILDKADWHKVNTVYQRSHAFVALAIAYIQIEQHENSAIAARGVLDIDPDGLEEDIAELLTAYVQAAQSWVKQDEHLRAYKFLNQIIPLAAHWGHVQAFSLLESTQKQIAPANGRPRQWEEAVDWLKTSLLSLRRTPSSSPRIQELAAQNDG